MDIEKLQEFFFWCMVVNMGIYSFSVVSVLVLRDIIVKIHVKMFGLDEKTVKKSIYMIPITAIISMKKSRFTKKM